MPVNKQSSFLGYVHSFRGFAALSVVALHAVAIALLACNNFVPNLKDPYSMVNELLFHDSTIYFTVISGLIFSAVLKAKGYKKFYTSKFINVLLPYLFLTLVFSISTPSAANPLAVQPSFSIYLKEALKNFIYGKAQIPYWYIPVLVFLFLVTPLLDYIMNIKRWGNVLTIVIILLPLVISRVELTDLGNYLSLSTMIHFTGSYAAGMYVGTNPEKWVTWFKKHMSIFIIISVLASAALIYFQVKDIDKIGSWSLRGTLFYIQKLGLSAIMLVLYKNMGERQPRWLHRIADKAFAIYFLHAFCLLIAFVFLFHLAAMHNIYPFNFYLTAVLFFLISLFLSIFLAWLFKKLFGKYSRMLVGT